jgi:hypothetical protein
MGRRSLSDLPCHCIERILKKRVSASLRGRRRRNARRQVNKSRSGSAR